MAYYVTKGRRPSRLLLRRLEMELCREKAHVLPLDVLQPCAQDRGLQGGEGESEKAPPLVCCFTSSSIALMCRGRTHVPPK